MAESRDHQDLNSDPLQGGRILPQYQRVFGAMRDAIRGGAWPVGTALDSEDALSQHFGVSRITIRHALRLLQEHGYLRTGRGRRATVVAASGVPRREAMIQHVGDIIDWVGDASLDVRSWRCEASSEARAAFGLAPGVACHVLRSVMRRDGRPYARSIVYFPPAVGSRLSRADFGDVIVFRAVERSLGLRVADLHVTVSAAVASAADCRELGCSPGSAILVQRLLHHDQDGVPFELAFSRSLASEVRFSTRFRTGERGD